MQEKITARIRGNNTVHQFTLINGSIWNGTPDCGSGNTHNINWRGHKKIDRTTDAVTCKKCQAIIAKETNR